MASAPLSKHRLVARSSYYGVTRADAVQVATTRDRIWYGKLKLLFRYLSATGECVNFALIIPYDTKHRTADHPSTVLGFYVVPSSPGPLQLVDSNAIDHRVAFIRDFRHENRYYVHK